MVRIPSDELDRLKREVSVESLAHARGIALKKHGQDLIGLCPFHDDREPSLVITPGKNLWHCLGACNAGGSVIDWVMRAEGVSFRHAVERLREAAGTAADAPTDAPEVAPLVEPDAASETKDAELLERVVRYYHETLKATPAALVLRDAAVEVVGSNPRQAA